MRDDNAPDSLETTDLQMLERKARALEALGLLGEALAAWRGVLHLDRNYLPAWEGSTRILRKLPAEGPRERAAQ